MEKIEAQKRYGDAIAQVLTKYAGVIVSPKQFTTKDGIKILNQQIKTEAKAEVKDGYSR